jgi:hypothetical protein
VFKRTFAFFAFVAGIMCLVVPVSAWATGTASAKMPPNPYGCTLCHGAEEVTPTEVPAAEILPLTEMGVAWAFQTSDESTRLWSDLSGGNVDGDGCSNGYEMGDPEGTYLPDGPERPDQTVSDPNVHDCTLPISEESWSRLKSLFDDN